MKTVLAFLAAALLASGLQTAQSQAVDDSLRPSPTGICGGLESSYGPFDYRKTSQKDRDLVEKFHFTPPVESLTRGATGPIGADLNYTLKVFPNHPRALYAVGRYARQHRTTRIPGAQFPAECYFDRAIRFVPDDTQVRALYADFLIKQGRRKEAREQLEAVRALDDESPEILYNVALAWSELGEFNRALPLARRAYHGGIQFPALRDRLKAAGVWQD